MRDAALHEVQCPTDEVAAYIDGELDLAGEMRLESHLAICKRCSAELTQQKQFLCSLNASLREENEIDLPSNFAQQIVANAESTVSGLRRPRERYNAFFIVAGLFLFVLFAMGGDAGQLLAVAYGFVEQTAAVGGFIVYFVYSVLVGLVIILRSFASQVSSEMAAVVVMAACFGAAVMLVSRRFLRLRRA